MDGREKRLERRGIQNRGKKEDTKSKGMGYERSMKALERRETATRWNSKI